MSVTRTLLCLSIGANVLLALWWAHGLSPAGRHEPEPPRSVRTTAPARTDVVEVRETMAITSPYAGPDIAPFLRWAAIAADDPRVFCRNLRALGCPEYVVRELVISQVNDRHQSELLPLVRQMSGNFWERAAVIKSDRKIAVDGEVHARLNGIQKARRNVLEELFGDGWVQGRDGGFDDLRDGKRLFSFLAPEKLAKAITWDNRRDEALMSIYRERLPDEERETLLAWTRADLEAEGKRLFSPEEWEEYQLRKSKSAHLPGSLYGVDLEIEERRALVRLHDKYGEDNKSPALEGELKELLGTQRFADFQRAQDNAFKDVYRVTLRLHLPKEAAVEVYEAKQVFEGAAREIRAGSQAESARRAQLMALEAQAEATSARILGEAGFETYRRNGGWWVQNLGRLEE